MLLYNFVKYASRLGLRLYFGKLEINGVEHIPLHAPFIIAANHQNAFLDAVIVASLQRKPIHFLTRSDVFVSPFKGILATLHMMPVYRLRDGYEQLKKNDVTFARCNKLLDQGRPVLIFPEGNMDEGHALRPLTKGTARMAYQAQEGLSQDLYILPVGINYFHHSYPRHKLILNYGRPLKVADYLPTYEAHQAKGLIKLRNELSEAMHQLLLIPDNDDLYDERLKIHSRQYEQYNFDELRRLLINPASLSQETYQPSLRWLTRLLSIPNLGPHLLIHAILLNIKDPQFMGSLKYIIGLIAFPLWWILMGIVSYLLTQSAIVIFTIVVLSIVSLFARAAILNRVR